MSRQPIGRKESLGVKKPGSGSFPQRLPELSWPSTLCHLLQPHKGFPEKGTKAEACLDSGVFTALQRAGCLPGRGSWAEKHCSQDQAGGRQGQSLHSLYVVWTWTQERLKYCLGPALGTLGACWCSLQVTPNTALKQLLGTRVAHTSL